MKRLIALVAVAAVTVSLLAASCSRQPKVTAEEATAIAQEAYVWGYPLVELYKVMYFYAVYKDNPEYRAPFNQVANTARVFTPADTTIQTPNSDTPYSMAWLDLRTEPAVITVPPVEEGRYFSVQLVDLYTFNFDYIGTRTTGNGGGNYLVTGPGWTGTAPEGIAKVIPCETQFAMVIIRTQLFSPEDIENVKQVQAGYAVQPLSAFAGTEAPKTPEGLLFPPYSPQTARTSGFFQYLNFVLQFCPVNAQDAEARARFEKIGVVPGEGFAVATMKADLRTAIEAGMREGSIEIDREIQRGISSAAGFGTRAHVAGNWPARAAAARVGLLGNSAEEAMYFNYRTDADGVALTGANAYTIRFAADAMPPAGAFWSVTMYDGVKMSLVENPIHRYLINSPMLPSLVRDRDGGLTLYIQKDSPGKGKEANWLPAPAGEFYMVLRVYLPKPEALDGTWKQPAATKVK